MSRYIDADELQGVFNETSTRLLGLPELSKDIEHMVRAFLMATQMIQDAPTADVREVVRGEWESRKENYYVCSVCKGLIELDGTTEENGFYFCPRCGADMRGDLMDEEVN